MIALRAWIARALAVTCAAAARRVAEYSLVHPLEQNTSNDKLTSVTATASGTVELIIKLLDLRNTIIVA